MELTNTIAKDSIKPHTLATRDLVSIVIPTADRCELLLRAIQSVHAQTHQNWELIIVDDASTDDTVKRISELSRTDTRIILMRNEARRGGGYSRHRGAERAAGDFIAFLDSDDYWLPHKLERQLSAAKATGSSDFAIVSPMAIAFNDQLIKVKQPELQPAQRITDYLYCRHGASLQASGLMVSGALGRRIRFDPQLSVNQDTDYLLRLEQAGAQFIYIPEALHVQDVAPRTDRISLNSGLIEQSLAWFNRNSQHWTDSSRRGFYLSDTAIRVARTGDRVRALKYFFRGLSKSTGAYYALRQFIRVLSGGELPGIFSKLWLSLRQYLPFDNSHMVLVATNCMLF